MKNQQSCISVFVPYLMFPSNSDEPQPRHDNNIACKAVWQIHKDTEQHQEKGKSWNQSEIESNLGRYELYRTNQGSRFLGSRFSGNLI